MDAGTTIVLALGAVATVGLFVWRARVAKKIEDERQLEMLRKATEEAQAVKDAEDEEAEAAALKHKKKTDRGG